MPDIHAYIYIYICLCVSVCVCVHTYINEKEEENLVQGCGFDTPLVRRALVGGQSAIINSQPNIMKHCNFHTHIHTNTWDTVGHLQCHKMLLHRRRKREQVKEGE